MTGLSRSNRRTRIRPNTRGVSILVELRLQLELRDESAPVPVCDSQRCRRRLRAVPGLRVGRHNARAGNLGVVARLGADERGAHG